MKLNKDLFFYFYSFYIIFHQDVPRDIMTKFIKAKFCLFDSYCDMLDVLCTYSMFEN